MKKTWKRTFALGAALFLAVASGASAYESQLKPFKDVPAGDWSEEDVYTLTAYDIVSGYEDGSFRPDSSVTREQFVKMLMTSLPGQTGDSGQSGGSRFADVTEDRWSYPVIRDAAAKGYVSFMIKGGSFLPEEKIKRAEVAVLIGRYLLDTVGEQERALWLDNKWKIEEAARGFLDAEQLAPEYRPYAYYASYRGIMTGDDRKQLHPGEALSRKEAAAIIRRTIGEKVERHALEVHGFYAINSYRNIDQLKNLSGITFSWSNLGYTGEGKAKLETDTGTFKMPEGWNTVVDTAKQQALPDKLMIFSDNADGKLSRFLQDGEAKQSFIQSLKEQLIALPMSGVSIDFEGLISGNDREPYTAFLRSVKEAIGAKTLSVAVPPVMYYKGYDLKEIGALADEAVLMAYDFTHRQSGLPSAPLPLVRESLAEALRSIPKEKLLLGISKQANQWITKANGDLTSPSPSIDRVESRLAMDGVQQQFQLPFFLRHAFFTTNEGSNELWYEDTKSISAKLELARYFGLKGVALWHIGNFTAEDWALISKEKAKK
ncbi:S-layer homology domain-containing protein [Paenibacillus sp. MBLB4367]|uniref:S-layer homology domain-containing protein n=1 Tax=Paenibacillus sp. MBLB4367 TaxID=3384767 RepID=UPI0039084063